MEGSQKDVLSQFYERSQKEIEEIEMFRCHHVSLLDCRKSPVLQVNISFLFPSPLSLLSKYAHWRYVDKNRIVRSSLQQINVLF